MTVLSDLDDDIPLDALIQKKKNENNNGNKEPEKIIPLSGNRFASWLQIKKAIKWGSFPMVIWYEFRMGQSRDDASRTPL